VTARRWLRVFTLAGGAVALASFARADAPTGPDGQYGLFNQSTEVIPDQQTGLYWQRYPSTTAVYYANSFDVCASLSLATPGGSTGWRVPSYKELMTILDEVPHTEYEGGSLVQKFIDSHAFPGTQPAYYWTSSPYLQNINPNNAYAIDFGTGSPNQLGTGNQAYVRCVHD
jgi:hypothetical protein